MFHEAEECILYFGIISVAMVEIKIICWISCYQELHVELLLLTDSRKIKITVLTFL